MHNLKSYIILCIGLLSGLLSSCKSDSDTAGWSVLDADDAIIVCADTFSLQSGLRESLSVISMPDSFLVGEIETRFGTLRASLLTQLSCPVGFAYPDNAEIDSIRLFLYYRSWVGDEHSALAINVYEIDRQVMAYTPSDPYQTQVDIQDYCSDESLAHSLVSRERIVIAGAPTDSVYNSSTGEYIYRISLSVSQDFCERFAAHRSYDSQEEFNQWMKGLYIATDFGSSTILNITDVSMGVYYHFSYRKYGSTQDTTVSDLKAFYANSEVRQLNRFEYLQKQQLLSDLQNSDTSFIISPACVYTQLRLPMAEMEEIITSNLEKKNIDGTRAKVPYVSLAQLRVEVLNADKGNEKWLAPAQYMLLVKDNGNRLDDFFAKRELPSDTVAILGVLTTAQDSLGEPFSYYTFDLNTLLTNQLRQENNPDTLCMTLVPVTVERGTSTSGATSVLGVKQSETISATMIRSAKNSASPMTLKVVYSGF